MPQMSVCILTDSCCFVLCVSGTGRCTIDKAYNSTDWGCDAILIFMFPAYHQLKISLFCFSLEPLSSYSGIVSCQLPSLYTSFCHDRTWCFYKKLSTAGRITAFHDRCTTQLPHQRPAGQPLLEPNELRYRTGCNCNYHPRCCLCIPLLNRKVIKVQPRQMGRTFSSGTGRRSTA